MAKKGTSAPNPALRFAVIGAGASGILCGIKLLEAGLDNLVLFEKADRPGGNVAREPIPRTLLRRPLPRVPLFL